jgi:Fe-S cluster assembly protein SufD
MQQQDQQYAIEFEQLEKRLNGMASSPIHKIRKEAIARFSVLGFPTTKQEEWRFTNVAPVARTAFTPAWQFDGQGVSADVVKRYSLGDAVGGLLVFINGHWSREHSRLSGLPQGVTVENLSSAMATRGELVTRYLSRYVPFAEHSFAALNTAFMQDGVFIHLPDGASVESPLHILYFAAGGNQPFMATPRNLIVMGKNCRLSLAESYVGLTDFPYLTAAVSEVVVGEDSVLEHDKMQVEGAHAFHVGLTAIHQDGRSVVTSNSIALGGQLVRNEVTVVFAGEGSESTLNGLSVATGKQLVDNHTTIDHARANCVSHELYKSILDGTSHGVFNGKILVRPDAQKTDARQTNKTLLLSGDAVINTKPQLEIFADDVKCTHGATVGQLDDEQLFYLRSRGIGLQAARDLLTFAFASDVAGRIHIDPFREQLDALLHERLREGRIVKDV